MILTHVLIECSRSHSICQRCILIVHEESHLSSPPAKHATDEAVEVALFASIWYTNLIIMSDPHDQLTGPQIPREDQKQAGKPVSGPVGDKHKEFLEQIFALIDSEEIDPYIPGSLVKEEIYEVLDDEWKDRVDMSLSNIANQIRLIDNFRKGGGDLESIHFHTMVEHLWEMKQRIEEHHDAFKI